MEFRDITFKSDFTYVKHLCLNLWSLSSQEILMNPYIHCTIRHMYKAVRHTKLF